MQTFTCECGNRLFFENTACLACGRDVGWCPVCRGIAPLDTQEDGSFVCGNSACGATLKKCHNYAVEQVCNRCLIVDNPHPAGLCDDCRFNEVIPDLAQAGNRERWRLLEQGKRRLLYTLDLLGLPYGTADDGVQPPLSFAFMADPVASTPETTDGEPVQPVTTGHAKGRITINLREADDVERERARVEFGEAHRTIIGHFRHEVGHYFWDLLIAGRREEAFRELFGDHESPTYGDALQRHYEQGPPPDWNQRFISAYASMHPWEDFAETFAAYLDLASVLYTAHHMDLPGGADPRHELFETLIANYGRLGVAVNELNRTMGLLDLVPEVFVPAVVAKLEFVHNLVREVRIQPQWQSSAA